MTNVNQFNITDEELREIEQIKELAQDCTTHLLECLVDPDTEEKVELNEEDKKDMYKFILDKTMEYAEECKRTRKESKFIKHPATFFSETTPFTDYLKKKEDTIKPEIPDGSNPFR